MKLSGVVLGTAGVVALAGAGFWIESGRHAAVRGSRSVASENERAAAESPWTTSELQDLLGAIGEEEREGLVPSKHDQAALQDAVEQGRTGPAVDALADAAALSIARDYAAGRIRNRHRFNWYIDYAGPGTAELMKQITAAREQNRLSAWLRDLLPTSQEYRVLRDELAHLSANDPERRDRLLANMERWRWLPRDFGGGDQLYVNLPTYQLKVVEDGRVVHSYKAVIGATDMPTPVLSATVRQVIANPDWIVPPSIVRRSHLRPGASSRYIFSTRPDGTLRVRQRPGPGNALGRVKIEFPNKLAIYFHDTPSKSLFGADERAFSHGCVRVQGIETLATSIVAQPDRFGHALEATNTQSFRTARQWRANIVYLTLARGEGGALSFLGDPYHMDEALAAALERRKPRAWAPAPIEPVQPTIASQHSAATARARSTPERTEAAPAESGQGISPTPTPSAPITAPSTVAEPQDLGNVAEAPHG